jgi:hypothetical protein
MLSSLMSSVETVEQIVGQTAIPFTFSRITPETPKGLAFPVLRFLNPSRPGRYFTAQLSISLSLFSQAKHSFPLSAPWTADLRSLWAHEQNADAKKGEFK